MSTQAKLEDTPDAPRDTPTSLPSETFRLALDNGQEISVTRKSVSVEFDEYTVSGLAVPPELEAIGRKNSAALERLMKRLDGD